MKNLILPSMLMSLSLLLLSGCATAFKGYYSTVELRDAPDSLRVFTAEGLELPVTRTMERSYSKHATPQWSDKPLSTVQVRSKNDPILVLKYSGAEKRVQLYGKIAPGRLILSTALGIFPAFIDGTTGNWNSFDAVDASFKQ